MPAIRLFHLLDLINPETNEEYLYQTWCADYSLEYCGKLYENFLCVNIPFASSSWGINSSLLITIPNISIRRAVGITRDFIINNNYLRGWIIKIVALKVDDPNWITSQIPYIISSSTLNDTQWGFKLENPTNLTVVSGKLIKNSFSDQLIKEMPRTFS